MDFARDFYWHDSTLLNIKIDREDGRNSDTVSLFVDWYDDGKKVMIFEDVYWAKINFNFRYAGKEVLDLGYIASADDADFVAYQDKMEKWAKRWNIKWPSSEELNCYVIQTITSGSEIKIIAKSFRVENL